jgi:hypothetical protein
MPEKIEIWFLSIDKTTGLYHPPRLDIKYSKLTARGTTCQKMGDYCFDPQVGLYKPGTDPEKAEDFEEVEASEFTETQDFEQIESASSLDRQVVKCDGSSFFDIFCGKAKKPKKPKHKLEIWIDVSSTMRQVDHASQNDICKRQSFLEVLDLSCPLHKNYEVQIFNESLRYMGMKTQVCQYSGLNNQDRLIEKIKKN